MNSEGYRGKNMGAGSSREARVFVSQPKDYSFNLQYPHTVYLRLSLTYIMKDHFCKLLSIEASGK